MLIRSCSVAALAALLWGGCDNQGFEDAVNKRTAAEAPAPEAASSSLPTAKPARVTISAEDRKGFAVLPAVFESESNPVTDPKVALGRMLYFEKRLSKNHDVSCNSCHDLKRFGVDNERTSQGHKGQRGDRNSPTVYNAGHHVAQFWDGRAKDLEEQALGPILNPVEMAMASEAAVERTLRSMPEYVTAFKAAFPDDPKPLRYVNVGKAIGAFERKLVTPGRFDQWLAGDEAALSDQEVAGFAKFIQLGCPTCHVGPAVGGTSFQKLGLVKPWPDQSDVGRQAITKHDDDKLKFRVPSLRNIEKTGPYFHKGQLERLQDVVELMAWHQLGTQLEDEDVANIVAFLESLTGTLPTELIEEPPLPPSTASTPQPDAT